MRRAHRPTFPLILCAALGIGAPTSTEAQDSRAVSAALERQRGEVFVLGEVIAKLKEGAELGEDLAVDRDLGDDEEPAVRQTSGGEFVFRIDGGVPRGALSDRARSDLRARTLEMVELLRARPEVEYAEPNYIQYPVDTTPDDPRFDDQWHYANNGTGSGESRGGINLPRAWDLTTGDPAVVVAVLDTGILPNHPDIAGSPNLLPGYDLITDTFFANDGDGRDPDPTDPGDAVAAGECPVVPPNDAEPDSWHGSHVAGTVGVVNTNNGTGVAGVNWSVGIVPVRVLGKCGGTTADITDAIRWAVGLPVPGVPANANPAHVVNLSLGGDGSCSAAYQSAIDDALATGATIVVAAGNSADNAAFFRPASCNGVITVAAGDERGHLARRYSNFGATVEIMAPGGDVFRDDDGDGIDDGVLSTVAPASGTYRLYNGTSMAAPHVAGVAALMLAVNPALTAADILGLLQSTAVPRSSTQCPDPCGAGLLDAFAAVNAAVPSPISLAPAALDVRRDRTAVLTATTLPGVTVTFTAADPSIATVAPTTATTDATGVATATVTGRAAGATTVTATAAGGSAAAVVRVNRSPGLSLPGVVMLAWISWLALRRRR